MPGAAEKSRQIMMVDIDILNVHPRNSEIYGHEPIDEGLLRSIRDIGIDSPLEITTDFTIIKGHRRLQHASRLGMKRVPCIIRDDLQDDLSVLFTLIEDNRHQRTRTLLQRQKETEALAEIIRARRAMTSSAKKKKSLSAGVMNSEAVEEMSEEEAERLDAQIEEAQMHIGNSVKKRRSINLAMQMTGMNSSSYEKAKRVNTAVNYLMDNGREIEAISLKRLVTERSLAAAVQQASTILGLKELTYSRREKKPKRTTLRDQAANCRKELRILKNRLKEPSIQVNTALKCIEAFYSSLGDSNDQEDTDGSVPGDRSGQVGRHSSIAVQGG